MTENKTLTDLISAAEKEMEAMLNRKHGCLEDMCPYCRTELTDILSRLKAEAEKMKFTEADVETAKRGQITIGEWYNLMEKIRFFSEERKDGSGKA